MNVPMIPERRMVFQYFSTSPMRGRSVSNRWMMGFCVFAASTVSISAKPKAPTSAGISGKPPARSWLPKVKRSCAWMPSCPIYAMNRPRNPSSQPLSGSLPVRLPDISTPKSASQKNS